MKKAVTIILSVIAALFLIPGAILGVYWGFKFMPSKEVRKDTEWFGAAGDKVAILYQDTLQDETGIYVDGQVYLPLEWVTEHLNERFYWDTGGQQLIFTLPDQIVYAGLSTLGGNGAKLIQKESGQVYVITGIISSYTDVQMEVYANADAKRIFIDNRWLDKQTAVLSKEAVIREKGGVKSAILTTRPAGDTLTIVETMEKWSKVKTTDGFIGYVENKRLTNHASEPQLSSFVKPEYTNISLAEEICMVWHPVSNQDANQLLEQRLEGTKGINVIAPTWFMLTDNQGNYQSLASKEYVDKAHEKGLQVWATADNFNKGDNVNSEILFASTQARGDLIAGLIADVKAYGIDGINLDIEGIRPAAGPHYVQFIRELSVSCRKEGIVLSVDTYVPSAYTAFYNRAEQGQVADYVIIMAYDEHTSGGEAGSVSSLSYVRDGIKNTLKEVPKEKLICGLPFYTRLWKEEANAVTCKALDMSSAAAWVTENQVETYWQEELGQAYGELNEGESKYRIWLEDDNSLRLKLQEVRDHELAGAAYWRLGFETADIWNVVMP